MPQCCEYLGPTAAKSLGAMMSAYLGRCCVFSQCTVVGLKARLANKGSPRTTTFCSSMR